MASTIFQLGPNVFAEAFVDDINNCYITLGGNGPMYNTAGEFKILESEVSFITAWSNAISAQYNDMIIPDGVTTIADSFMYLISHSHTKNVVIGSGVQYIGKQAFANNNGVVNVTTRSNVLTEIRERAFASNKTLETADFGSNVQKIGDYAFQYCENAKRLNFHFSPYAIGRNAFADCGELTSLQLSNNIVSLGIYAFGGCRKLVEFNTGNTLRTANWITDDGRMYTPQSTFQYCNSIDHFTLTDDYTTYNNRLDIFFYNAFEVEKGKVTNPDSEGNQITYIHGNMQKAYDTFDLPLTKQYSHRVIVFDSPPAPPGEEFLYVAHKGQWIHINGYDSNVGQLPVAHKGAYKYVKASTNHSSSETPIYVKHKGQWYQIGY